MIDQLRGQLVEVREGGVVVEVGGVAFWVLTPQGSVLPEGDDEVRVYTYLHVREDALELFGFGSAQEREVFRILLGVSGVGPRMALGVIAHLPPDELQSAVLSGNAGALRQVKGVGPKLAERLALELKGKLDHLELAPVGTSPKGASQKAAYLALTQLGFGAHEARRALEHVSEGDESTEVLVKKALAWLSGGR